MRHFALNIVPENSEIRLGDDTFHLMVDHGRGLVIFREGGRIRTVGSVGVETLNIPERFRGFPLRKGLNVSDVYEGSRAYPRDFGAVLGQLTVPELDSMGSFHHVEFENKSNKAQKVEAILAVLGVEENNDER